MATTNTTSLKSKCPPLPPVLTLAGPSGMRVGYRQTLHGFVSDPKLRVQALVYSADKQWYLQRDAVVRPSGRFTIDVHFGYPESFGNEFTVVVTAGHVTPVSPIDEVPANAIQTRPKKFHRHVKP